MNHPALSADLQQSANTPAPFLPSTNAAVSGKFSARDCALLPGRRDGAGSPVKLPHRAPLPPIRSISNVSAWFDLKYRASSHPLTLRGVPSCDRPIIRVAQAASLQSSATCRRHSRSDPPSRTSLPNGAPAVARRPVAASLRANAFGVYDRRPHTDIFICRPSHNLAASIEDIPRSAPFMFPTGQIAKLIGAKSCTRLFRNHPALNGILLHPVHHSISSRADRPRSISR